MKICLVCSQGGHYTETLQILDAFQGHQIFFATYHSAREADVRQIAPAYFINNIGKNYWRMIKASFWALKILLRERPDAILSLGSEIAIPFFYLGKLLRIRTIFIESWCRVDSLSGTGRWVYPVADVFLVQWPELLSACGPKARYEGAVI
ncbi:MAG: PssD/Cps14F family polysaccharide biosynthesis glycosyltransferase [Omnitrophica WOR_2 bacterium]